MKWIIIILVLVIGAVLWSRDRALEAKEIREQERQQQLAFSDLTVEVVKNITLAVDTELSERVKASAYGIAISENYDLGYTIIISKNTPYTLTCSNDGTITTSFGAGEDAPSFWLEAYTEDLPFLPTSVAGKKLTGILCAHVAASLYRLTHTSEK